MATSVNIEDANRPLADYTISVNELLEYIPFASLTETTAAQVSLKSKRSGAIICGESSEYHCSPSQGSITHYFRPAKESPVSLSRLLDTQMPSPALKRERRDSFTPDISDDEEQRMHARYLLNLASPEAASRTPSEASFQARKKPKSRYANNMAQPFTQMVRPAYEFMSDVAPLGDLRYLQHGYTTPNSPPQSPPEIVPRLKARP
jgi:hypothetical protein